MNIIRGKQPGAKKIVIFGPEGIGKSTFAASFPDPVFIDTEDSTKDMDVARFEKPSSWPMLKSQVQYVIDHPETCRTLVIDTADWAEQLEISYLCSSKGWDGLEGPGYGKGYTYSMEEFGKLLDLLTEVINKGIHVVITAHAQLRKVELPEEMGAYDHWELKVSKKVAPMVREWADAVFFANYKINVVNVDNQGAAKGKNKAQGGRRVMYTNHTPFWDAKNRYGLPEELPFSYDSIKHVIEGGEIPQQEEEASISKSIPADTEKTEKKPKEDRTESKRKQEAPPAEQRAPETEQSPTDAPEDKVRSVKAPDPPKWTGRPPEALVKELDKRIPKMLRDLMIANGVQEWDITNICEAKGYVPYNTPIWEYDTINPGLIEGGIVGNWDSVLAQIKEMYEKQDIPFI